MLRSLPVWAKLTISATAVAGTAVGGLAAAGASSNPIPPGTIHGCVDMHHSRTLDHVYTLPSRGTTCPPHTFRVIWGVRGPAGPQGPAGNPGPATLSVTGTTAVSNRDDSGAHGNWATDAYTRVVTVTRHGAVAVSHCGSGAVSCYFYTAALADNGTFVTDAGAYTPNQNSAKDSTTDGKIKGAVQGTMTGGSKIEFYAGSANGSWDGAPSAANVPATVSGDSPSTGNWVKTFFPASTIFTAPSLLNWSWTYNAPATCEQWTDAYSNGGGNKAGDGNIAGSKQCAA